MNRKGILVRLLWCGILLALLLTMCVYPSPTPPPSNTPTPSTEPPTNTPTPVQGGVGLSGFDLHCQTNPNLVPAQKLVASPFFVEGQVILTGTSDGIRQALQQLAQQDIVLTEVMQCEFTFPRQLASPLRGGSNFKKRSSRESEHVTFPFYNRTRGDFTLPAGTNVSTNLYNFDQGKISLRDLLSQIRQLPISKEGLVYADPNYLIGHLANSACGNPFGVEGSPFGVEGSPFGVEGSPFGGAKVDAHPDAFWNQWAFTKIGLVKPEKRKGNQTGAGVRVGVFDTSPYTLTATTAVTSETSIQPVLTLTVHHPFEIPELDTSGTITQPLDVSDHGLFAASLIHAVAYESEIHLYQVLTKRGCGDLYHLNISMLDFIASGSNDQGLKQPAVISLSLGVRKPRELPTDPQERQQALADIAQLGKAIQAAYSMISEESSIKSLEFVVTLASRDGIFVAAAAGNDSVFGSKQLPMELPAAYPFVMGVSATNPDASPACYTNEGDVAAPGGAAAQATTNGPNPAGTPVPICKPMEMLCPAQDPGGQCEYGVIGLFSHSPSRYAYWVGTSFATPIVSGLAAVAYQQTGSLTSVFTQITNHVQPIPDSDFGSGIVQFP